MDSDKCVCDVLIVGSGPCGLATAARLREKTPSALFSEAEHQRFHWLKSKHVNLLKRRPSDVNSIPETLNIKVIDATSSSWLGQWDNQFGSCGIPHLRSPMFFHPDPFDVDGMIAFAHNTGREKELMEINGIVGKELSKHQQKKLRNKKKPIEIDMRDFKDYYRPSTPLYRDYCESIIKRYSLQGMVSQEKCQMIDYNEVSETFTVTSDSNTYVCPIVVIACGPIGSINYDFPQFPHGSCHTTHLFNRVVPFPPTERKKTVVVVGGGLTSAQICHRLIESKKADKVYFVLRGDIKVKHFDFDLEWVTKYKNYLKSTFWMLDTDEERAEMILKARNGGSVNPQYLKIIHDHEKSNKLVVLKNSKIAPSEWDGCQWNKVVVNESTTLPEPIDYIYYATGSRPDFNKIDFLANIRKKSPISTVCGFPCLTDDLEYNSNIPLYFLGRLASLKIGPASANLEGARVGAERIASSIQNRLEKLKRVEDRATVNSMMDLIESDNNWYGILAQEVN
ncbi:hypothetical protein AWJ20_1448 [Sugiyamaella lignohabitans]|uniref:L-ornithine N(5)-monooxygenase [NAD(P)H] n=1 Tax=Sugiyamaella lignohabitans TaxID=796027 RepID=A0A167DQE7_9ASCO|nr:uncharacterized protein AWJ20_1448 [Sugiyamaella lignohabitans]ANB13166.1 hypothetical protein AWJ20_1448 [Sugiyamaella lignohabitans]